MPVLRATALTATALTVRWGNVDTPTDPVSQTGSLNQLPTCSDDKPDGRSVHVTDHADRHRAIARKSFMK
jgi:hypothetical protein